MIFKGLKLAPQLLQLPSIAAKHPEARGTRSGIYQLR
jgi:hypothetical protein